MTHLVTGAAPKPIPASAGIGLRSVHHEALLAELPPVGFIEVHTENYFHDGGAAMRALRARAKYPISLHGVGLGLGSADGVDREHLARERRAVDRVEPALVSEHACWSTPAARSSTTCCRCPTPRRPRAAGRARSRRAGFQSRQLLIENVSAYVAFEDSQLSEWDFLGEVVARSGCGLLLDVNNVYVSARNLGLDAQAFIAGLPHAAVQEIHLAGHARNGSILIDNHGSQVCEEVWDLYGQAVARFGPLPTLIEWDTDIPSLATLVAESVRADQMLRDCRGLAA